MAQSDPEPLKVSEAKSDLGRKALLALMFICLLVFVGVAINIMRNNSSSHETRNEPTQAIATPVFNPAEAVSNFTSSLTRQRKAVEEKRAKPKPEKASGFVEIPKPEKKDDATLIVPQLTPEQKWKQTQELKALEALGTSMEIDGKKLPDDGPVETITASPNGQVTITNPVQSAGDIDALLREYRSQLKKVQEQ